MTNQNLSNPEFIFSTLLNQSDIVFWTFDIASDELTYISDNISYIIGTKQKDIMNGKKEWISKQSFQDLLSSLHKKKKTKKEQNPIINIELIHKDGFNVNGLSHITGIYNKSGTLIAVIGAILQINEYKGIDIDSFLQYFHLSAPYAAVFMNNEGTLVNINDKTSKLLGYKEEEVKGQNYLQYVYEKDRKKAIKYISGMQTKNRNVPRKLRLVQKNNNIVETEIIAASIRDYKANISTYLLVIKDITELESTKRELKEREDNIHALFNATTDSAFLIDYDGLILMSNEYSRTRIAHYFPEFTDKPVKSFVGINIGDYLSENDLNTFFTIRNSAFKTKSNIRIKHNALGRIFDISASPISGKSKKSYKLAIFIRDITDKEINEKQLTSSEANMKAMLNATSDSAYLLDINGLILDMSDVTLNNLKKVNPSLKKYSKKDLIGTNIFKHLDPDFTKELIKHNRHMLKKKEQVRVEIPYLGNIFDITISPVFEKGKKISRISVFVRNITKEVQAEYKLLKSEMKYQSLVDNMFEGFVVIDKNLNITYVNNKLVKNSGFPRETFIGKYFASFYDKENRKKLEENLEIVKSGQDTRFTVEFTTANKERITLMQSATPILDDNGNFDGLQAMLSDITLLTNIKKKLQFRADFQTLISFISTSFINLNSAEIDLGIQNAIMSIGMFNNEERVFMFQISDDKQVAYGTHEWCAEDIPSMKAIRKYVPLKFFTYSIDLLKTNNIIHIYDISKLPEEAFREKKACINAGIKSFLNVPIMFKGTLIGFLGFESISKKKEWDEDSITLLRIISNIFANALERKRIRGDLMGAIMSRLSDRELEFLKFLVEGYVWPSDKRLIGKMMDVLPGTLDKFMSRIKEKIRTDEIGPLINTLRLQNYFNESEEETDSLPNYAE